jgi:hypothetical protein
MEDFMRKWEPQLQSMQRMITELHEVEFASDDVDSMSNSVNVEGGPREEVPQKGPPLLDVGKGSPLGLDSGSDSDFNELDK